MGRGDYLRRAAFGGDPEHPYRRLHIAGAVVHSGDHMCVDVDHAVHQNSIAMSEDSFSSASRTLPSFTI